jgi:hypothetical protein
MPATIPPYDHLVSILDEATPQLFQLDPRTQAVEIAADENGLSFNIVRNLRRIVPAKALLPTAESFQGIPITYDDAFAEITPLYKIPASGSAAITGHIPEQLKQRHVACGVQIQNVDCDYRQGILNSGRLNVGTLGCFVKFPNDRIGVLSCNHVIAGENAALVGDRINQPGCSIVRDNSNDIARLYNFSQLRFSPAGGAPQNNNAVYNQIDSAVAMLDDGVPYSKGYLAYHNEADLRGVDVYPKKGDAVFKIGRTTGRTTGVINAAISNFGPVNYDNGQCWFRRAVRIRGTGNSVFSAGGDSGSIIANMSGEAIAVLFATNGIDTWGCRIDVVLRTLNCSLLL